MMLILALILNICDATEATEAVNAVKAVKAVKASPTKNSLQKKPNVTLKISKNGKVTQSKKGKSTSVFFALKVVSKTFYLILFDSFRYCGDCFNKLFFFPTSLLFKKVLVEIESSRCVGGALTYIRFSSQFY